MLILAKGNPEAMTVLALIHRNYSVDKVNDILDVLINNDIKGNKISKIYNDCNENIYCFVKSLNI